MDAFTSGGGNGWLWGLPPFNSRPRRRNTGRERSKPSDSVDTTRGNGYQFPLKQAATAASLALAGDTIAQLRDRWKKGAPLDGSKSSSDSLTRPRDASLNDVVGNLLSGHDLLRSLRMTSYGFLLYGPGSYAWYQYLDHCMPKQTVTTILSKVVLNQVVLGPIVIAVVFAWNNLWLGKLSQVPKKYKEDALPTLLVGFRFWIPVSILNFWMVPLQARVAFMSMGSIFWNFCLSSTMNK
ncbi:protein sym-1 [Impatiens glandulifera]|uniref:protein sym-1 n=1 Tax=Impatiens glandulifera TaxID=253017 RepID=UPI001FB079E4|nr:protein sym-1 [Impatiens glandulifera]